MPASLDRATEDDRNLGVFDFSSGYDHVSTSVPSV
jgi:hypothetical protein